MYDNYMDMKIYEQLHRNMHINFVKHCKGIKRRSWRESWFRMFQMVTTGDDKYRPSQFIAIGRAGLSINLWAGLYSIRGLMPAVCGGPV